MVSHTHIPLKGAYGILASMTIAVREVAWDAKPVSCCGRESRPRSLNQSGFHAPETVISTSLATSFQVRPGHEAPESVVWRRDERENHRDAW
jgi:hypothetical protein